MIEREEKEELAQIKLAIKVNDEWIWFKPGDLHILGTFQKWRFFIYMDLDCSIKVFTGEKFEPEKDFMSYIT